MPPGPHVGGHGSVGRFLVGKEQMHSCALGNSFVFYKNQKQRTAWKAESALKDHCHPWPDITEAWKEEAF